MLEPWEGAVAAVTARSGTPTGWGVGRGGAGIALCRSGWLCFGCDVGRLGTGRSRSLSGSGCLSARTSVVPRAADVSPSARGLESGASRTARPPLSRFETPSRKAADRVLLWAKELSAARIRVKPFSLVHPPRGRQGRLT